MKVASQFHSWYAILAPYVSNAAAVFVKHRQHPFVGSSYRPRLQPWNRAWDKWLPDMGKRLQRILKSKCQYPGYAELMSSLKGWADSHACQYNFTLNPPLAFLIKPAMLWLICCLFQVEVPGEIYVNPICQTSVTIHYSPLHSPESTLLPTARSSTLLL